MSAAHDYPSPSVEVVPDLDRVVELMEAKLAHHAIEVARCVFSRPDERKAAMELGMHDTPHLSQEQDAAVLHGVLALGRDVLARMRARADLPIELPAVSALVARRWARDGQSLTGLSEGLLLAQELLSDCLVEVVEATVEDSESRWLTLRDARARIAGYIQRVGQLFLVVYEQERSQVLTEHAPPSAATLVRRILNGENADSAQLGYRLEGPHIALVGDNRQVLHNLARRTGRDLLDVGGREIAWGWLGGERPMSDTDLDALVSWQRSREGRVGFGEPAFGLEGFRSSYRNALAAWRIVCALHLPVVRFADESLLIAVTRDHQYAHIFVEHYLGPLSEPLRQAVRAYVELGQNVASASARLGRSRRTVERQLRRVEDVLGRPIRDCASELLIATRAADVVAAEGDRVVRPKRVLSTATIQDLSR
jgi:GGDEF-like domain/PucR C-terminal helix-turn-helix domain